MPPNSRVIRENKQMTDQEEKKIDEYIVRTYGAIRISDFIRDQVKGMIKQQKYRVSAGDVKDVKLDRKFNEHDGQK